LKPFSHNLDPIAVTPAAIGHFAMSHSHGDHAGNANLFAASTIYMQGAEYDAVFGSEPQKYNFTPANFEKLRGPKFSGLIETTMYSVTARRSSNRPQAIRLGTSPC
jgi:N-acyl homoserine lactone hydrolase